MPFLILQKWGNDGRNDQSRELNARIVANAADWQMDWLNKQTDGRKNRVLKSPIQEEQCQKMSFFNLSEILKIMFFRDENEVKQVVNALLEPFQ